MKMKIGFIGFKKSAQRYHLPFIDKTNLFDVIGYYSRSNSKFQMPYPKLKNVKYFSDLDTFLDSEIELVVISTPPEFHYEYAIQAILKKKHVLVEKPIASSLDEVTKLYELARENNVKIVPYQNRRFDSDFLAVKEVIKSNEIKDIVEIQSNFTQYRPDIILTTGSFLNGVLYSNGVHFIDQIVSLYGEPEEIIYDLYNQKTKIFNPDELENVTLEDSYFITLIYKDLRVRLYFSGLVVKAPHRWVINGSNATYLKKDIDQQERDLKLGLFPYNKDFGIDLQDDESNIYYLDENVEKINTKHLGYEQFYIEVYKFLKENGPTPVSEKEAKIVMNILETIHHKKTYKKII